MGTKAHVEFGQQAEQFVAQQFKQQGYTIIAQNYRTRLGELDVVVRKKELVAIIEVKARVGASFPYTQVITHTKQRRIYKAALSFLQQHSLYGSCALRFDVALVRYDENGWHMQHLPGAFVAEASCF